RPVAVLPQVAGRLAGEIGAVHVLVRGPDRQAGAVEPDAGRVAGGPPGRPDFHAPGGGPPAGGFQGAGVVGPVDALVEAVLQAAVEVHLADGRRVVAGRPQEPGQGQLAVGEGGLKLGNAEGARVAAGEERLAGGGADRRVAVGAVEARAAGGEAVEVRGVDGRVAVGPADVGG